MYRIRTMMDTELSRHLAISSLTLFTEKLLALLLKYSLLQKICSTLYNMQNIIY